MSSRRRRLAALVAVAVAVASVEADCPATEVSAVVGGLTVHVAVPGLLEGDSFERPCESLRSGFEGFLRVSCFGVQPLSTIRCQAKGCRAGQRAAARIGDSADLLPAEITTGLAHGKESFVPCRTLKEGLKGYVNLRCSLGVLSADAASCHSAPQGARTAYRLLNADYLPGAWRVFEAAFYDNAECQGGRWKGEVYGVSEESETGRTVALAFDGNRSSFWSAWCPRGCAASTAWLALALPEPRTLRCVSLQQSQVSCCRALRIHLEVWDGQGWQLAHTWDVPSEGRLIGHNLVVPSSCTGGLDVGAGIQHDCAGAPVVGLKEGATCKASCAPGFVGGDSEFVCQGDGTLQGTAPTCVDVQQYTQFSIYILVALAVLGLGCIYSCVCMVGKARLTYDVGDLPKSFQGRWLESKGMTSWELMIAEQKANSKEKAAKLLAPPPAGASGTTQGLDRRRAPTPQTMSGGASKRRSRPNSQKQGVDGACSPCEDPDLCLAYFLCPLCRQADTWHTLGVPEWQTYWKVLAAYILCPWCWPCLNFYGRYRIRQAFKIHLEPHRDFLMHCCCCCCCSPCGHLQEARLVDAPILYFHCKHKLADFHIREVAEAQEEAAV